MVFYIQKYIIVLKEIHQVIVFHKSCHYNYFARPFTCKFYYKKTTKHVISSVKQLDRFSVDHRNSTFVFIWLCHRYDCSCAVQFSHYSVQLSSLSELVGVTDPKSSLLLLLPLPTGIVIYSCLLQGSAFGYSIPHTLLPLFLHILLFRQIQVMFPCFLCIVDLCTHFILLLTVIFIFTLSTELQMSLSLSFSDCECCEKI